MRAAHMRPEPSPGPRSTSPSSPPTVAPEVTAALDEVTRLSNDLNGPLLPLREQLEALSRELVRASADDGPRALLHAELMQRQVRRIGTLVSGLKDLSQLTSGQLTLERRELDLARLVREVVTRAEPDAAAAGCSLYVEVPERLLGEWDASRLEQVITHLLMNALEHGAGHPVRVAVHEANRAAQLVVDDEGVGIEPEELPRIFGRNSASRRFAGPGMGLYLTRQIVEAHGGVIRVESAPGKGTRFEVELPRSRQGA